MSDCENGATIRTILDSDPDLDKRAFCESCAMTGSCSRTPDKTDLFVQLARDGEGEPFISVNLRRLTPLEILRLRSRSRRRIVGIVRGCQV